MTNKRIDQSANLLVSHEEVVPGLPAGFIEALEDQMELETGDYYFHPLLIESVKSLKVEEDTWLMWWDNLFIGVFSELGYAEGDPGCIENIDDDFWNDFVVTDKGKIFDDNENYGDMKISAEPRFVEFIEKHPDHYKWYDARYKRPDGYQR